MTSNISLQCLLRTDSVGLFILAMLPHAQQESHHLMYGHLGVSGEGRRGGEGVLHQPLLSSTLHGYV